MRNVSTVYTFEPICVANPCVLLFDFGGRPEKIKEVNESHETMGKDFSDVRVPLVEGGTTLLMIPSGDKLRIFDA